VVRRLSRQTNQVPSVSEAPECPRLTLQSPLATWGHLEH
jgi:hypothetical protein